MTFSLKRHLWDPFARGVSDVGECFYDMGRTIWDSDGYEEEKREQAEKKVITDLKEENSKPFNPKALSNVGEEADKKIQATLPGYMSTFNYVKRRSMRNVSPLAGLFFGGLR